MPFGDVLSEFKEIYLETADGCKFNLKNNFLSKIALRIVGIPHVELRIRARKIFSLLPKKGNNMKILDAGCGPGIYSLTLSKKKFQVYAVDIDNNKLDFLRKKAGRIKIFNKDITNLPFKNENFDFVLCSDVLEHIKNDKKAVKELTRVLRKGGSLILTIPSYSKKNIEDYKRFGHQRVGYKIKDVKNLADKNELEINKIKKYSGKIIEKIFEINEKIYANKALLGVLFYFLYLSSFIEDLLNINEKNFNGLAVKLVKSKH